MLRILRRITQEVANAANLSSALSVMVERVREAIEIESCSIFLCDGGSEQFVLVATDGLNPKAVGKVRINRGEGLVSLVGEREEPVNIDNAPTHPRFLRVPEVAEERFHAFLGVPVIHHKRLLGVIILQQQEPRRFDESEEAFLVTISAQIAPIIAEADSRGELGELLDHPKKKKNKDSEYSGLACVPGIGIGTAVVVYPQADLDAVPDRDCEDPRTEIDLYYTALIAAQADVQLLIERVSHNLPEAESALFDAYLKILQDEMLSSEIVSEIHRGQWAQGALRIVIQRHVQHFEAIEDLYLRERAEDLRDLGRRILSHLQARERKQIIYPPNTILVGEEVTAAALVDVPDGQLIGLVSLKGSRNSHVTILARAMNVPTIMGIKKLDVSLADGHEGIVDGYAGHFYISPSTRLRKEFIALAEEARALDANLSELRELPACTPDGYNVALYINTGLNEDAGLSLSVGAEGVGLFRTEVPFMQRDHFPSEDQQRILYRQLLNAFAPRTVVMRTLDIGGDKMLSYFPIEESNPFLGWRGIRVTLDHPEVFIVQLRAMLKASVELNNLHIMLPMITTVSEVDEALRYINKAHRELHEEGYTIAYPSIGVMVEVPSAIYQIHAIASRVDFISVGSNDLIQYILAVDRNNLRVADLYDGLHPSVLIGLSQIVEGCKQEGKPVSICGEMAGDPASVILLIAMGFEMLSVNPFNLPKIKWVIRNFTRKKARELLHQALGLETPDKIRELLEHALVEAGFSQLIRSRK